MHLIQKKFLRTIVRNPNINLQKLRNLLDRTVSLEADRQVLNVLKRQNFILIEGDELKNQTYRSTEKGKMKAHEIGRQELKKKKQCELCGVESKKLDSFKGQALCSDCLTQDIDPSRFMTFDSPAHIY